MRRWTVTALALLVLPIPTAQAQSNTDNDLVALFRMDAQIATSALKWRGPQLTDDVALAVAALGLVEKPAAGGMPLLRDESKRTVYAGWPGRAHGFAAAKAANERKAEFSFALSLLLAPDESDQQVGLRAHESVGRYDDGLDRVLIGILSAPDRLPLVPTLQYAATDLLVWRASPRNAAFMLALAESGDVYLRSRAVLGLGLLAYRREPGRDGTLRGLLVPVAESGGSVVQRRLFEDAILRACDHRSHRVRVAAALALGLSDMDGALARLGRMVEDPAYISTAGATRKSKHIVYPVREAAAAALARLGRQVEPPRGDYEGRELRNATRGGRDVTKDRKGLRSDRTGGIRLYSGVW